MGEFEGEREEHWEYKNSREGKLGNGDKYVKIHQALH